MRDDRLRKNYDEIHNLEDIIEAHDERKSHIAGDIDSFEQDVKIPEDIDVDEALTFPHPKNHKKDNDIDLMDTPHKEDVEQTWDWSDQDIQPTDYEHEYDEATSTYATDDMDQVMESEVHLRGVVSADELSREPTTEVMPDKFTPDEETEA